MLTQKFDSKELAIQLFEAFSDWYNSESELQTLHTKNGDTQNTERNLIDVFEETLKEFGFTYKKASSQKPYDFRICLDKSIKDPENNIFKSKRELINKQSYSSVDLINDILLMELKKTQSNNVILNDTIPQQDSFYVITNIKKKEIGLWAGGDIIVAIQKQMKLKNAENTDVYEYEKDVKRLREKHGIYTRMNLSFSYKLLPPAINIFSIV